jgi:hypothetical protein
VGEEEISILHATYVDDASGAYIALAESERKIVVGQCYNITVGRYEVLKDSLEALVKEYRIEGGFEFVKRKDEAVGPGVVWEMMLMGL